MDRANRKTLRDAGKTASEIGSELQSKKNYTDMELREAQNLLKGCADIIRLVRQSNKLQQ